MRNLSVEVKSRVIKKDVFNRIRRSEEELQKAAEMVRGGMTFQTASDTFNIPISTIRYLRNVVGNQIWFRSETFKN